ncbi:MAG: hypothetical protein M1335_07170, partial [Chloroflexi bacterium]|nr:hypothetical protein [Chloroflexota bacterium]
MKEIYRNRDITGLPIQECAPCLEEGGLLELYRAAIETGEPYVDPEFEYISPEAGPTYWCWSLLPFAGEKEGTNDLMVVLSDITEQVLARRRVEELGRLAQEHATCLETVIESIADGIIVVDAEGRPLLTNAEARRIAGFDIVPDQAWKDQLRALKVMYPNGKPVPLEETAVARPLRGEVVA